MMLLTIPELFARDFCKKFPILLSPTLMSMDKSAESMKCVATKQQYNCKKVEDELEADQKYKVIQCDTKSLEANTLTNMSFGNCIWNGLKISGDSLVNIAELPGAIAAGIAKSFQETQFCNTSVDKKRQILKAFNLTVDDARFKIEEQRLGLWLNDASCSEIEKLVSARYQNYQNTIMRERIAAINTGKKPKPLSGSDKDSKDSSLAEMLKSAMGSLEQSYECYTPKVKAEMICAGVTSLLADAALGGGVAMATKRMAQVMKSTRALANIRAANASGQAVDLADAAVLLNKDRIKAAAAVLNKTDNMTEVQNKAIIAAHEIGKKEGRGFYEYTKDDILKKARILREAGFDPLETRALMEAGVTGSFRSDAWARSAMVSYMDKMLKISTSVAQQESLIALHELGISSVKGFSEQARALLKRANFTDAQIDTILKAKQANEQGLLTVANIAVADKKIAYSEAAKSDAEKRAADALKASQNKMAEAAAKVEDSAGRKAVLNNFRDDELINGKHLEIPEGLAGDALEAKKKARRANAQEIIKKIEKKERREFDVQGTIIESGSSVSKSRKILAEVEADLAKLPKTGSELRKKELLDKIDRSSTSLEMYQKRCKAALELYREAHGYEQYMRQYQRDYDNYCK